MNEYNICGVLLHVQLEKEQQIKSQLKLHDGLETHAITEDGRMVITIENPSRKALANSIMDLHKIDGVLSAAMIYQYSDSSDEVDRCNSDEIKHQKRVDKKSTSDYSNKALSRADI